MIFVYFILSNIHQMFGYRYYKHWFFCYIKFLFIFITCNVLFIFIACNAGLFSLHLILIN